MNFFYILIPKDAIHQIWFEVVYLFKQYFIHNMNGSGQQAQPILALSLHQSQNLLGKLRGGVCVKMSTGEHA